MSQLHSRLLSGDAYPLSDVILTSSDQIQGITLTDNGKVVLSQFYGRDNDSTLSVYMLNPGEEPDLELNLNGQLIPAFLLDDNRLVQSITAIPMSESLATTSDDKVLVLYESDAIGDEDGKHRTSYVWSMTVE